MADPDDHVVFNIKGHRRGRKCVEKGVEFRQ